MSQTVQANSLITLNYRIELDNGTTMIDTFQGTPATLQLGAGEMMPALEACLAGLAVGVFPVARPWVDSGRLVAPLDARFPLPERFHLLYRQEDGEQPGVAAVRAWARAAFRALDAPAA